LLRDLAEHLLSKVAQPNSVVEPDELDDVTCGLTTRVVTQEHPVAVELFHQVEFVAVAHAHDDDRCRQVRRVHDQLLHATHIMDGAIRQNQQHWVCVRILYRCGVGIELLDHLTEVGWPSKLNQGQVVLVGIQDSFDSWDARVLGVAIEREAVSHTWLTKSYSTEAERRELLRIVIRLKDGANLRNGFVVLVVGSHEVQRLRVVRVSV